MKMDVSRNYLLGSMQLFVTAAGTIGNFLVILVILSNRSLLRNIHYYLVLHLAICDFFTLMFPTSLIYHAFTGNSMLNSQVLCKLWRPAHAVFYNAGVLFMVIISVVRFQAVLKPLEPAMRRWKVKILAMSAYIFAIVWTIPYVLVQKMNHTSECVEEWPVEELNICYTILLSAVQYFLPVVVLSTLYWKICIALVRQNREMKLLRASPPVSEQQYLSRYQRFRQHRNARTFSISFVIVICFAMTAAPRQIIQILGNCKVIEFPWYYFWLEVVQFFGVSAVNPFIYGTLDRKLFGSLMRNLRKVVHVHTYFCIDT